MRFPRRLPALTLPSVAIRSMEGSTFKETASVSKMLRKTFLNHAFLNDRHKELVQYFTNVQKRNQQISKSDQTLANVNTSLQRGTQKTLGVDDPDEGVAILDFAAYAFAHVLWNNNEHVPSRSARPFCTDIPVSVGGLMAGTLGISLLEFEIEEASELLELNHSSFFSASSASTAPFPVHDKMVFRRGPGRKGIVFPSMSTSFIPESFTSIAHCVTSSMDSVLARDFTDRTNYNKDFYEEAVACRVAASRGGDGTRPSLSESEKSVEKAWEEWAKQDPEAGLLIPKPKSLFEVTSRLRSASISTSLIASVLRTSLLGKGVDLNFPLPKKCDRYSVCLGSRTNLKIAKDWERMHTAAGRILCSILSKFKEDEKTHAGLMNLVVQMSVAAMRSTVSAWCHRSLVSSLLDAKKRANTSHLMPLLTGHEDVMDKISTVLAASGCMMDIASLSSTCRGFRDSEQIQMFLPRPMLVSESMTLSTSSCQSLKDADVVLSGFEKRKIALSPPTSRDYAPFPPSLVPAPPSYQLQVRAKQKICFRTRFLYMDVNPRSGDPKLCDYWEEKKFWRTPSVSVRVSLVFDDKERTPVQETLPEEERSLSLVSLLKDSKISKQSFQNVFEVSVGVTSKRCAFHKEVHRERLRACLEAWEAWEASGPTAGSNEDPSLRARRAASLHSEAVEAIQLFERNKDVQLFRIKAEMTTSCHLHPSRRRGESEASDRYSANFTAFSLPFAVLARLDSQETTQKRKDASKAQAEEAKRARRKL